RERGRGRGRRHGLTGQGTRTGATRRGVPETSAAHRRGPRSGVQSVSRSATLAVISRLSRRNEASGWSSTSPRMSHQAHATAPALATKSGTTAIPRAVRSSSASAVVAALAASTTIGAVTEAQFPAVIAYELAAGAGGEPARGVHSVRVVGGAGGVGPRDPLHARLVQVPGGAAAHGAHALDRHRGALEVPAAHVGGRDAGLGHAVPADHVAEQPA